MALVTLQEAKDHLMVDNSAGDAWLTLAIEGVSDAVLRWLKEDWRAYQLLQDESGSIVTESDGTPVVIEDSSGPLVKPVVKMAALVEVAVQFRFRDGKDAPAVPSHWGHGFVLSTGATALLAALRKTTVA